MVVATPYTLGQVALDHLTPSQVLELIDVTLRYPGRYAAMLTYRLGGRTFDAPDLARELLCVARACRRGGDA